ncbi:hypothetical protein SAMN04488003_10589 [Loktanella fryxellensis]|uniref:Uncharacterized protein n=1 Tax=Loktanella fryxellensis TaxID=245187 RepID=A0A1H8BLA5_9RHOB|nr:hypothetical protein [Loktanella fryxellensis]SEM83645.1 hypothetical protein SAMN04488003_10589 [Loktanella fryxellensis]
MRLEEVEREIRAALARINRPDPGYVLDLQPRGDGTPHVEGQGPFFDLVVDDGGAERTRETLDGHELLYRVLRRETRLIAMRIERETRRVQVPGWLVMVRRWWPGALDGIVGTDDYARSTWIDAHVRLMSHLRQDYGARVHNENDALLRRFPLTAAERRNHRKLDLSRFGVR